MTFIGQSRKFKHYFDIRKLIFLGGDSLVDVCLLKIHSEMLTGEIMGCLVFTSK